MSVLPTRIHRLTVEDALAALRSSRDGLSETEARRRLLEYGPNRIEKTPHRNRVFTLLKEFTQFFSLVLWAAAALAFFLEHAAPGQGMARLGYSVVAVIIVSGVFSYWQEYRAEKTLAALVRLLPAHVRALRAGTARELESAALVPGDIVLLGEGDDVPADCRVMEAYGARVNVAALTGESVPQACNTSASPEADPTHASNVLFAGTTLEAGHVQALVFATGTHTEFGAIAALAEQSGKAVSPLRQQIAHASELILKLALGIGVVFFVAGWWIGIPLWADLLFAIGIIVAMVPEGLLPTLTLALAVAAQRMAARNVLIRNLPAVEALGSASVICTDKTGTLTQNRMAVRALLLGSDSRNDDAMALDRSLAERYRTFFVAAALCSDVTQGERAGKRALLGDPMEVALVELARNVLGTDINWRRLDEIPFDAERMRCSTLYETPEGQMLYCKGAPETVVPLCTHVLTDAGPCVLSDVHRHSIAEAHANMAERGLRVLAIACRPLPGAIPDTPLEQNLVFCGLAGLEDPPRPEVRDAIRKCREAGIKVIMVTGDHPATACALAREIGLVQSATALVLTGDALRRLSPIQLQLALDAPEIIFARVAPDQKLRIVETLKRKGAIVAVTGDGVNDAPALKSAHIGIAMGVAGTDAARAAADVVLLDDNFASIAVGIEEGRAVFDNIRKLLTYILAHNVPELVPYLAYALLPVPLAITPMQILAIDMGTDSLTALGLGVERADPRAMQRPPRSPDDKLLDRGVALRAYLFLGLLESIAAMSIFFIVLSGAGWTYGAPVATSSTAYLQATAACLVTIVVMQTANVLLCRSADRSIVRTGVLGNPLILCGIAMSVGLAAAITYAPVLNVFFGTAPFGLEAWLMMLPFAAALITFEELRKSFVRRRARVSGRTR